MSLERQEIVRKYDIGRDDGADIDPWEDPKFEIYHRTDRFGFIHDSRLPAPKGPARDRKLVDTEMQRVQKWLKMKDSWPKYFGTEKFTSRIYKGIPDKLRGDIWCKLLAIKEVKSQQGNLYRTMRDHARRNSPDIRQIDLDVNRTYRDHIMFRERYGLQQNALFHVLAAYSVYNTDVGYCQGMSHVAALLLMYMSEEDAFWALSVLMSHPRFAMHGLFVPGFPKLKRFHSHVDAILTKFLPRVRKHLVDDIGVPLDLVSVKWFLQCFLDRVPFTLALRIYDIYLLEGERLLIAFSYTLYRMHRRILLKLKSLEEAMEFLQNRIAVDGGGLSDDALIDALRVSNAELRKHKFDIPKQAATAEERPTKAFGLTYNKVLSVGDARAHVARTPQTGAMKNGSPPPFSPSLTGGNSQTSDSRLSVRSDQTAVSAELGTGPDSTPKPISRLPHDPERANAPPALVNGERGDDVDGSDIVDTSLGTMLATGGGPPPSRVRRRLPARPPGHQHMHQPSVSFADDVVIDSNTPRHSRQSPVFGKHVTRIDIRPQVSPRASTAPAVLPPNGPMPPSGRVSSRFIPMAELQQQQNDYYRGATLPQQQQQYPTAFGPHDAPLSVPYFATGSGSLPSPFDFTRSPSAPGNAYATPMGQPTYEYDLTLPTLGSNHQYSPHSLPPRFDAVNSIAPQQQMLPPHHYYPAPPPPPAYDPRFVGAPLHDGIGVYSRDREECFDEEEELEDDLVDELNGGTDGYAHPSPQPPAHLSTTARGATVIRIG